MATESSLFTELSLSSTEAASASDTGNKMVRLGREVRDRVLLPSLVVLGASAVIVGLSLYKDDKDTPIHDQIKEGEPESTTKTQPDVVPKGHKVPNTLEGKKEDDK